MDIADRLITGSGHATAGIATDNIVETIIETRAFRPHLYGSTRDSMIK